MGREKRFTRELMVKELFDILLLLVNCIGIVGAFYEILEIPWDNLQDRILFWGSLFIFCVMSVLFWRRANRKRILRQGCAFLLPYVFLLALFRRTLFGGLFLALQNAVVNLNTRYQFHITWPDGLAALQETGWKSGSEIWIITVSILFFLFPLVLLAGFLLTHVDCFWLFLGNGLWFTAACACNRFPDIFFLIFCVLGTIAVLVQKQFEDNHRAGILAVICVMILSGCSMGLVSRFLLPIADVKYEEGYRSRMQFYELVNEEWIPKLQRMLSKYSIGIGSGPDVTGTFNRQTLFAYTTEEVYRVTLDSAPAEVLYLKGYVGVTYGKKEWISQSDRELQTYYKEHKLELPEDLCQLANISYIAVQASQARNPAGNIRIEELAGKGSYSVYPYGAMLTEDYQVHADGSVERKGREYSFSYRSLSGILRTGALQEPWKTLEEQYRQYVLDNFLDYPEGLESLAEHLEQADISTENAHQCVGDIVAFLKRQASYNLDAGQNPPGEDFVEYFLFESHEGYCVHFASAAVLALRYFGIPARYVTGYALSPSDFSKDENGAYTAVVTGRQAHAWAEIYLDGKGWVPVEATPGAAAFSGNYSTGLLLDEEEQALFTDVWMREEEQREDGSTEGEEMPESSESESKPEGPQPESKPEGTESESKPEDTESEPKPDSVPNLENQDTAEPESVSDGAGSQGSAVQGQKPENGAGLSQGTAGAWADPETNRREDAVLRMLKVMTPIAVGLMLASAICFLGKYLHERGKRRWHDAMQKAEARLQILLLYRNMRKALRAAGCPERLDAEGEAFWQALRKALPEVEREEYDSLYAILEKASFGNVEPSDEELRQVCGLHDRLVKEVYEKIPFYKKPLFGMLGCYL